MARSTTEPYGLEVGLTWVHQGQCCFMFGVDKHWCRLKQAREGGAYGYQAIYWERKGSQRNKHRKQNVTAKARVTKARIHSPVYVKPHDESWRKCYATPSAFLKIGHANVGRTWYRSWMSSFSFEIRRHQTKTKQLFKMLSHPACHERKKKSAKLWPYVQKCVPSTWLHRAIFERTLRWKKKPPTHPASCYSSALFHFFSMVPSKSIVF